MLCLTHETYDWCMLGDVKDVYDLERSVAMKIFYMCSLFACDLETSCLSRGG